MKFRNMFFLILIIMVLSFIVVAPAFALSPHQDSSPPLTDPLQTIINVGTSLATMAGIAALLSVIVNVLKYFKAIADGNAGRVFALLNLIAFIILASMRVFAPQYSLAYLDGIAAQIATIALFITGYLFQLGIGQQAYYVITQANIPILSHSSEFCFFMLFSTGRCSAGPSKTSTFLFCDVILDKHLKSALFPATRYGRRLKQTAIGRL